MPKTVYVLNGPNLNLLGKREPEIYGSETLADVEAACARKCRELGIAIRFHQCARYVVAEQREFAHDGPAPGWRPAVLRTGVTTRGTSALG